MASQDFRKESVSSILRQCVVSSVDACSVRSEDFNYGMLFQSDSVLSCFGTDDTEMVARCLIDREAHRENARQGLNSGLSLALGSRIPSDQYSGDEYTETSGRVHNSMNHRYHGMGSALSVLQNLPHLKPAQDLLCEVVCVSNAVEPSSGNQVRESNREEGNVLLEENQEVSVRITKLTSLLNQLDIRCENYFHQINGLVSSFEMVAGTGAAAAYTALMIQVMSKYFCNLRDAIVAQLDASRNSLSEDLPRNQGEIPHRELMKQKKRRTPLHEIHIRQVWKPLRGLPEASVTLLQTWLFKHFLHPYPDENEKRMLVLQTGLTRIQISNWFINARVRFWKPMIEEMYKEEFAEDMQESDPPSEP